MSNNIIVSDPKFGNDGKQFEPQRLSVGSDTTEKFKRENAMQMWAKTLDSLGLDYLHVPSVTMSVKKTMGNMSTYENRSLKADFYIKNANVFAFVRGYSFDEEWSQNYDATDLAKAAECNVMVLYTDGKFRLVDYYDCRDRALEKGNDLADISPAISDEAMFGDCRKCGGFYSCTSNGWWGCRHCGHYDGDNTAASTYYGSGGFFK